LQLFIFLDYFLQQLFIFLDYFLQQFIFPDYFFSAAHFWHDLLAFSSILPKIGWELTLLE